MAVLKNEFSWSRTRAQVFEECRRKYWFSYYGHWGGWEPNASERSRSIWILKKLQTRWMWAGDLVHRAVAETLELLRAGGKQTAEEAAEKTVALMRVEFDQSRKKKNWQNPNRYHGLLEHEYEETVTDEQWGEVADHVRFCVKAFFASPFPGRLVGLPPGSWLPIEKLSSFQVDGVKVYAKPDFAYRDGETTFIIDWKTGRRDNAADPIQLAGYTLFALDQKWTEAPEKVVTIEYNLAQGRSREETMSAGRLEEVRQYIRASMSDMRPFEGKPEKDFPVATSSATCRDCSFRKVCPERPQS